MGEDMPDGEMEEKIKIMATDDERIKSFGEVLTNDSSREILQILFNDKLSAAQIAQKTDISLQLVRYHLQKLQDLGVVRISNVEKNSKSQDMKIYSATKFSIVIVPPRLSEKTKKSKMLVMSFRHIYKVAGLGIAAGFSGLLSLSTLYGKDTAPKDTITTSPTVALQSERVLEDADSTLGVESEQAPDILQDDLETEAKPAQAATMDDSDVLMSDEMATDPGSEPLAVGAQDALLENAASGTGADLFVPLVMVTVALCLATGYYAWKMFKARA